MAEVSAPQPLTADDNGKPFDCGQESLNRWFARHAWRNQMDGTSRTYVSLDAQDGSVAGFASLSTGQIERGLLPKSFQRNKLDPVPILLMGQLAVSTRYQGIGLGAGLLRHAFEIAVASAQQVGVFALATHPLNRNAAAFYQRWGFRKLEADPRGAMLIRIKDLQASGF